MKQTVKVPPSSTEVTIEITIPDSLVVTQAGGTPINPPPGNVPPVVNAGANQVITLPTSSVILNGTGQDPDGTIAGIKWEKVSGGAATIVNPNSLVTQVTGLVAGMYVFRLTLTDDDNDIASSTTNVEVKAAVVIPPIQTGTIEGYGSGATGGNGLNVVRITNLSQLQGAIGSNKTIIIDVSGTINTGISINNVSNLTIDAYTSKQDVTITNGNTDGLSIENSNNIIIRGIRSINNTGGGNSDGFGVNGSSSNVVFDHCSGYGNTDGNIDISATSGKNFTVQNCILGNDKGSGNMLITSINVSVHHNLFIGDGSGEGTERNPFAHSNYSPKGTQSNPNFDVRNNLIHASGRYATGCGYGAVGNIVNNYYTSSRQGLINLDSDSGNPGKAYVAGNFNQPSPVGGSSSPEYTIPAQFRIAMTDAVTAGKAVLQNVGPWKKTAYEQGVIDSINIGGGVIDNNPPVAIAGPDQNLPSGTTSASLVGVVTDSDGTASPLWTKVSGSGTITNPNSINTAVTGLSSGASVFQLKATDNKGATAVDNMTINVGTVVPPPIGNYTLVYETGYDDVNSIDPFGHQQWGASTQASHLSTTIFKTGPGSFKSGPLANVSSGTRSEVQYGSGQTPLEGILEYDVYYDNFASNSCHSLQWHPSTNGGSGTGLFHKGGKMQFVTVKNGTSGTNVGSPFTVSTKVWHHIKLTYKFGSSGYIKVEMDGVVMVPQTNVQMGDGSSPYLKVGVNAWENITSIVYYDNLKVYKKN